MAEVTLRQLRYFAVLGAELNYRRAAARLFITQPALSTAIKQLEQAFGVVLLTRNTREVALTDLGAAWLPQVQQALHGVDAVVENLVTLSGTRQGRLRVGYLVGTGAICCSASSVTSRLPIPTSASNRSNSTSPTPPPGWPTAPPRWR